MRLYRLGKAAFARQLDGAGARDFPGRWNSFGTALVYTSGSSSTAILEVRAHVIRLRHNLTMTTLEVPDKASTRTMTAAELPHGWNWMRYLDRVRAVGDQHVAQGRQLILRVPSVVDTHAWNYLLNPQHPEMADVHILNVEPYSMDPRLFRSRQ